jgi:hypothetical protein
VTPDSVLADIDGALAAHGTVTRDWSSPDAMHWISDKPELVICHGTRPLMPVQGTVRRGNLVTITADCTEFLAALEAAGRAMAEWGATITRSFQQAADDTAKGIAAAYGFTWDGQLHYHADDAPRDIRRRCLLCNPGGFSPPLAIDGREYRRRQKARRR